jgi:carbon-monoxide dehydrogenase medium subunit
LYDAAGLIGGPQVRNTATLGGNVAHALPAADGTIALLALDAQAEVASLQGTCRLPLVDLFHGPGKSALDSRRDLLIGFHLPLRQPGQASAFRRVMRPQGVAIAILNMAIWLERSASILVDIRISIGPAGPVPLRARAAETELCGQSPNQPAIERAVEALLVETHFRTSPHRSTADYRRHTAAVLLREVLENAWQRAA